MFPLSLVTFDPQTHSSGPPTRDLPILTPIVAAEDDDGAITSGATDAVFQVLSLGATVFAALVDSLGYDACALA